MLYQIKSLNNDVAEQTSNKMRIVERQLEYEEAIN